MTDNTNGPTSNRTMTTNKQEYDTIVQCRTCGRKQYLMFANGLKNGWSRCCGSTMPILQCKADIDKAVRQLVLGALER